MGQIVKSRFDAYKELLERSGLPMPIGMLLLKVLRCLYWRFHEGHDLVRFFLYVYVYTPLKMYRIRHKKKIKVLFVLTELGLWKTESLYRRMLTHARFEPILGLSASTEYNEGYAASAKRRLVNYCIAKGYVFYDLDYDSDTRKDVFSVDIIFYQKPYDDVCGDDIVFYKHLNALFCYALYGFHSVVVDWQINLPLYRFAWQNYFETELAKQPLYGIRDFKRDNMVITGLPMTDVLLRPKSEYADPWKSLGGHKRIIYAPHCTISDQLSGVNYCTFLEHAEGMLELASKYRDKVQWAFKPHPLLYPRLVKVWGKERTDEYYNWWRNQKNTQFEDGEYSGLFMHSDAMIHDCASFTIEYHYTENPVMYLLKGGGHEDNLNDFAKKAFNLHYKGQGLPDVEAFIEDVLAGVDPMRIEREKFFSECLLPPNGKTACDNIIDSILGRNGYK